MWKTYNLNLAYSKEISMGGWMSCLTPTEHFFYHGERNKYAFVCLLVWLLDTCLMGYSDHCISCTLCTRVLSVHTMTTGI